MAEHHFGKTLPGPAARLFVVLADAMERHVNRESAGFVRQVFSPHDPAELQRLASEAGFHDIAVDTVDETFRLPPAKEFLWQYVHSTPLAGLLAEVGRDERDALEREVVAEWQSFEEDGAMTYRQDRSEVRRARKRPSAAEAGLLDLVTR